MINMTTDPAAVEVDSAQGTIVATVRLCAPPERVFRALGSDEITRWWVRPGVFDTREWAGDVRPSGTWRASGVFRDQPYGLEGEFVEVDAPRSLVHTWRASGALVSPTTVSYRLEPIDGGTLLTLRHSGFASAEKCEATAAGWRTSLDRLAELMAKDHG